MVPNHFGVVQAVNAAHPELLQQNTIESCGKFTEYVVWDLAQKFPSEGWGHVGKTGGQTQYNGHAVDAIMSKLDLSKAIDIISNAHNPPSQGSSAWMEVNSGGQPWKEPIPVSNGGNGGNGGSHECNCQEELDSLQNQINELKAQLDNKLGYDSDVAIRMSEGLVINFVNGGGTVPNVAQKLETRSGIGAHEIVKLVKP